MSELFRFKRFSVEQHLCAMKVGTDGVLLGAWARGGNRILDIGCGTGVVALMMAQRFPQARVTAIDIMEDCCRQTWANAVASPFGDRVEVVHSALQDFDCSEKFSAVVSNPPFFVSSLKNPDKLRSLARHTDSLPFADLLRCASSLLTDDGVLSVIVPDECCGDFVDEALFSALYLAEDVAIKTVERKVPKRHLLCFAKQRPDELKRSVVLLQNADGSRSDWYQSLTKDFYL